MVVRINTYTPRKHAPSYPTYTHLPSPLPVVHFLGIFATQHVPPWQDSRIGYQKTSSCAFEGLLLLYPVCERVCEGVHMCEDIVCVCLCCCMCVFCIVVCTIHSHMLHMSIYVHNQHTALHSHCTADILIAPSNMPIRNGMPCPMSDKHMSPSTSRSTATSSMDRLMSMP